MHDGEQLSEPRAHSHTSWSPGFSQARADLLGVPAGPHLARKGLLPPAGRPGGHGRQVSWMRAPCTPPVGELEMHVGERLCGSG